MSRGLSDIRRNYAISAKSCDNHGGRQLQSKKNNSSDSVDEVVPLRLSGEEEGIRRKSIAARSRCSSATRRILNFVIIF